MPFFRTALDELGIPPERAVLIGDDLADDIGGAKQPAFKEFWYVPENIERQMKTTGNDVQPSLLTIFRQQSPNSWRADH